MTEKTPLYNNEGRVEDIDAAQAMARTEGIIREEDERRIFKPGKRGLKKREEIIEEVGQHAIAEKSVEKKREEDNERFRQEYECKRREWLTTTARRKGMSIGDFDSLPKDQQRKLEDDWKYEQTDAYKKHRDLEQRLGNLIAKKVEGYEVGRDGTVLIKFDDGTTLEFLSQSTVDWEELGPDFEGVKINLPQNKE